jgi:exodeoxyribonuclease-3
MKLISWNVNGVRATLKKGLIQFIEREVPDILCLQETKASPDQLDELAHQSLGPVRYWSSAQKKGYSGTATIMKSPCEAHTVGIGIPDYDSEGRFVITRHRSFDLYNVYFPNGARAERHPFKQKFLKDFKSHLSLELKKGRQIIVVGDYNIAPADIDVFDPVRLALTSGFLPEEKRWFQDFLQIGFVDTFRHLHAEERNRYSWWNQMERARLTNRGWRIDLICISAGLLPALRKAEILDQVEGSDHCPVTIEMEGLRA